MAARRKRVFYAVSTVAELDGKFQVELTLEKIKDEATAKMLQKHLEHFLVERYSTDGVVVWETIDGNGN